MQRMSQKRRAHFEEAMARGRAARQRGEWQEAYAALEEAHILGQAWVVPHLRSHWAMLVVALRQREAGEAAGQLMRLALVAPGTWLGRLPLGNTGRASVSAFVPMPVPERLQRLMAE